MQLIYKPFLILASASILLVSCGGNKEEVVDASETGFLKHPMTKIRQLHKLQYMHMMRYTAEIMKNMM